MSEALGKSVQSVMCIPGTPSTALNRHTGFFDFWGIKNKLINKKQYSESLLKQYPSPHAELCIISEREKLFYYTSCITITVYSSSHKKRFHFFLRKISPKFKIALFLRKISPKCMSWGKNMKSYSICISVMYCADPVMKGSL